MRLSSRRGAPVTAVSRAAGSGCDPDTGAAIEMPHPRKTPRVHRRGRRRVVPGTADAKVPSGCEIAQLGTAAAWISAVCCAPTWS